MRKQKLIEKAGVYAILIDNTVRYIGSSVNLESRKSNHLANLRKNSHSNKKLQELFNLHGEDNFEFYVLDYCDTENLYELENLHMKIHEDTIVNKDRVVKLNKHIKNEEELEMFRKKMSKIMSGEGNPNSRLSEDDVKQIIKLKKDGVNYQEIAEKFRISISSVNKIGKERWKCVI